MLDRIIRFFRFGRQDGEFELLETERGIPEFWGSAREEAPLPEQEDTRKVCKSLAENEERLRISFRADINSDLILRPFTLGGKIPAFLAYLNGMADTDQVSDFILRDGMRPGCMDHARGNLARYTMENVFTMGEAETTEAWADVKQAVMEGRSAVFIEACERAVLMDTRGFEHRSVTEPQAEKVVRGPQEAFVENLRTNITLLRRILHTEDLVCEMRGAGGDNGIRLAILYREGITNITLVEEVKRRLAQIDTRTVIGNGRAGTTHGRTFSVAVSAGAANGTAGQIGGAADAGTRGCVAGRKPICKRDACNAFYAYDKSGRRLYAPSAGFNNPHCAVYRSYDFDLVAGIFSGPCAVPSGLAFHRSATATVIASRKMVFAPIGAEMIFLLVVFQLIREAGMRVPGNIGQAIGIIGGLILGQAAVAANLASSVVLIVVALTGLGNFCIPDYSTQLAAAFFRLTLTIAAWIGGLLGVICLMTVFLAWMASLKSYGVPFLAPFSPKAHSQKPMILRGRLTMHQQAEDIMNTQEETL